MQSKIYTDVVYSLHKAGNGPTPHSKHERSSGIDSRADKNEKESPTLRAVPQDATQGLDTDKRPTLPQSLVSATSRVDGAISFLFRDLLSIPRLTDSTIGCLEVLGLMYMKARSSSLLRNATHAFALASLSNRKKSKSLRVDARNLYGKALRDASIAIQDPAAARSDELLMSIIAFSLYEAISPTEMSRTVWTRHINGAVSLIRLRGKEQFQNPTSLYLFRVVRATMLKASIRQGKIVEELTNKYTWAYDQDSDLSATNRLTVICLGLPNVRHQAQNLLTSDRTQLSVSAAMSLIEAAKEIDCELDSWAAKLPEGWEPRVEMVHQRETADFWPGPIHTYGNLYVANLWNEYRMSRIFCQTVILGCITALPSSAQTERIERISADASYITQCMVDDFCSALPYLLGNDFKTWKQSQQDEGATRSAGAFFAVWPLFVTYKIPTLPKEQRHWLAGRLQYVRATFGPSEGQDAYCQRGIA